MDLCNIKISNAPCKSCSKTGLKHQAKFTLLFNCNKKPKFKCIKCIIKAVKEKRKDCPICSKHSLDTDQLDFLNLLNSEPLINFPQSKQIEPSKKEVVKAEAPIKDQPNGGIRARNVKNNESNVIVNANNPGIKQADAPLSSTDVTTRIRNFSNAVSDQSANQESAGLNFGPPRSRAIVRIAKVDK